MKLYLALLSALLFFAAPVWASSTALKQGGGGDVGTLTDTGNLCAAGEVVTRDALDASFECSAAGAGDVLAVGDCVTGSCFVTGGTGTTLTSDTGLILDLDDNADGSESFIIRDGLDATLFTVTEGSAVLISGAGSNFNVSGTDPYIGINDTDVGDPADGGVIRLGNAESICWEISPAGTDACATLTAGSILTLANMVALRVPTALAPVLTAQGQVAYDTNIYGTKGAAVVHNSSETTYVVATTDAPASGEVPIFVDATDTVEWQAPAVGTVTSVGDCNGPACFTGAEGTTLTSNTGITIDLDDDTGGTDAFTIRDGANAAMLTLTEGNKLDFFSAGGEDVGDRANGINLSTNGGICFESAGGTDQCIIEGTNQISFTGGNVDMTSLTSGFYAPTTLFYGQASPAVAAGIVGTDERCIELKPADITCFGVAGCAGETIDGTGHSFVTANFATDADDSGSWVFTVPKGWSAQASTIVIDWISNDAACDSGATDTVCWAVDTGSVTDDNPFVAPTLGGTVEGITDTCIANGDLMRATITTYTHGMTAEHTGILVLTRDVDAGTTGCTADEYAQPAKVVAARICRNN